MGLEAATLISQLVNTNPVGGDSEGQGDDHLRMIKSVLQSTFPGTSIPFYLGVGFTNVVSASNVDLGAVTSQLVNITGATGPITGFGTVQAGTWRVVKLASTPTITHNATSLILPGAANIVGAAGDVFLAISMGSGNWIVPFYQKASGFAIVSNSYTIAQVDALLALQNTVAEMTDYVGRTAWTPQIAFGGSSTGVTYSIQKGSYIKVGALVTLWGNLAMTNNGTGVGAMTITGLPFPASVDAAIVYPGTVGGYSLSTGASNYAISIASGASIIDVFGDFFAGFTSAVDDGDVGNSASLSFQITYPTG